MKYDPYADHNKDAHYTCFYVNAKQQEALMALHSTGLWGNTVTDTITRLIDVGLRALQNEIQSAIWSSRPVGGMPLMENESLTEDEEPEDSAHDVLEVADYHHDDDLPY